MVRTQPTLLYSTLTLLRHLCVGLSESTQRVRIVGDRLGVHRIQLGRLRAMQHTPCSTAAACTTAHRLPHSTACGVQRQLREQKAYNMQHAAHNIQHAAHNIQHTTCRMQHATCSTQHTTCRTQHTTCRMRNTYTSLGVHRYSSARPPAPLDAVAIDTQRTTRHARLPP